MTPAGIEPATFRFVAQHLNHFATAVPSSITVVSVNGQCAAVAFSGTTWSKEPLDELRLEDFIKNWPAVDLFCRLQLKCDGTRWRTGGEVETAAYENENKTEGQLLAYGDYSSIANCWAKILAIFRDTFVIFCGISEQLCIPLFLAKSLTIFCGTLRVTPNHVWKTLT